jgi:nitrous oxidase accessory protein NosD
VDIGSSTVISNNIITGNGAGISNYASPTIVGNTITNQYNYGILDNGPALSSPNTTQVLDNIIIGNAQGGVVMAYSNAVIVRNLITGNSGYGDIGVGTSSSPNISMNVVDSASYPAAWTYGLYNVRSNGTVFP